MGSIRPILTHGHATRSDAVIGQYHLIANLDLKEYIHPHRFGDGLKLLEFGCSSLGSMTGLAVLLAVSNGRGGGDLSYWGGDGGKYGDGRDLGAGDPGPARAELLLEHIVGRWAGHRIAIVGDYHNETDVEKIGDTSSEELGQLWGDDEGPWVNISCLVIEAMELDHYIQSERHEEHTYPNSNRTYTRATGFGAGQDKPEAQLNPDGTIERLEVAR